MILLHPNYMSETLTIALCTTSALLCLMQFGLAVYTAAIMRISSKERAHLHSELFGIAKRIEGLTSSKREQILRHYDKILENLSLRLPTTIAAQTSQMIFDTESKVLRRLAELEPNLKENEEAKHKMDELIRSMESLEQTIVALTSDTVKRVLIESRNSLLEDDNFSAAA